MFACVLQRGPANIIQEILQMMAKAYETEPYKNRELCVVRSNMFDHGFTVFDVVVQ